MEVGDEGEEWEVVGRWRVGVKEMGDGELARERWEVEPFEEGLLGQDLKGTPQLCDTRGLQGRSDVRAPCFFLSWIKSPLDHIWPPFFVSPTPPHKR